MSLKTFDPKDVSVIIGGAIMQGFANGTFINVERAEDAYSTDVGADGEPLRVKSNNKMTTITLTLMQSSDSNSIISAFAILDEKSNAGVVPILIKDNGGDTLIVGGRGWVRKMANVEYGKESTNREWIFDLAESEMFVGGSLISDLV